MYYVAKVNSAMCSEHKCNMCTLYCPEPNTLMYDKDNKTSWVDEDRCKGCAICVYVCSDLLNRDCIEMAMVTTEDA
jgi:pyruvate ferredoxin oxidoreductase delta subunit